MFPSRWRTGFNSGASATKILISHAPSSLAVEIHFLNGDSRSMLPSVFPAGLEYWDFFFQDSMHFMSGILAEWEIMKPFARPGSVVVFDDVCLDWKKMPTTPP